MGDGSVAASAGWWRGSDGEEGAAGSVRYPDRLLAPLPYVHVSVMRTCVVRVCTCLSYACLSYVCARACHAHVCRTRVHVSVTRMSVIRMCTCLS